MRILIVDDDYISRTKLKALLSSYGDCDAAPSGDIAMQMIKAAYNEAMPYELITMDINMPDIKGTDVVTQIREWEKEKKIYETDSEAKILMVTVAEEAEKIMSSFKNGCEWYLVKPVTPKSLKESMKMINLCDE